MKQVVEQAFERGGFGDQAASGGKHELGGDLENVVETAPFHTTKATLPVEVEDHTKRNGRLLFDQRSSSRKGTSSLAANFAPKRGLACSSQSDQRNAIEARGLVNASEMLRSAIAGLAATRRLGQAAQKFGGVHQIHRRLRPIEH